MPPVNTDHLKPRPPMERQARRVLGDNARDELPIALLFAGITKGSQRGAARTDPPVFGRIDRNAR